VRGSSWRRRGRIRDFSPAQRATAIAGAGLGLLEFLLAALGETAGRSGEKQLWKALTPDSDAHASVFLADAMGAILGRYASRQALTCKAAMA
jgi:hypothetical protein